MLLISAKRGAKGNAATKIVVKPNCKTETKKSHLQELIEWGSFCGLDSEI